MSPAVKLAVVATFHREAFDGVFDHVIIIRNDHNFEGSNSQNRPDGLDRQWLTRILYLTTSPFTVTLAYDANIAVCNDVTNLLARMSDSDFDIATANSGITDLARDAFPHNLLSLTNGMKRWRSSWTCGSWNKSEVAFL